MVITHQQLALNYTVMTIFSRNAAFLRISHVLALKFLVAAGVQRDKLTTQ